MNPSERKANRLLQIEALLLAHPKGLTQAEIARRLGINRSTVTRYYPDLPRHIYVDDDRHWVIDRDAYLVNVRFSLHEALAVHLAARLLATRMDRKNPHAAAALRKMGVALETLAPCISTHMLRSADDMDDPQRRHDPVYLEVIETITTAWAERRKVSLCHRHENGELHKYSFSPYFIEPYAVGQSVYAIGFREPPGAIRTLKLERIESAELLNETYTVPEDFDPQALLADAWGIWYTEQQPVEVILKFGPRVAHRVRESRWHRSEQVTVLPDDSLLWRAWIAEPQEMMPWIRGWGSDVEVVAPKDLRERMEVEARTMAILYGFVLKEGHR